MPALLISAAVTGLLCVGAVAVAPGSVRAPVAWGSVAAAVLLTAAVTTAAYALDALHRLRAKDAARAAEADRRSADAARVAADARAEAQRVRGEADRAVADARDYADRAVAVARTGADQTAEAVRMETERTVAAVRVEADRTVAAARADAERAVAELRADADRTVAAVRAEAAESRTEAERVAALARVDAERALADAARARGEAARSESSRAAAIAACANAAGRMQALATSMLADLREMEHRHSDEDVLTDLLHLDHRTAQAGRLADSVAVLTGARSGRRWAKPIVMESILRGAMGRIGGYQRVRLHNTSDAAIAGHAAEGVMHALAELLDNAATFSPPTAEVHVYVEDVPAGLVVTIEDSGLVMSEVQLRRAEQAVTADHSGLTGLSGTRLGLAVVGKLARKHGLAVSFRPSARGGTGVVVRIPHELVSRTPNGVRPSGVRPGTATRTPARTPAEAPAQTTDGTAARTTDSTAARTTDSTAARTTSDAAADTAADATAGTRTAPVADAPAPASSADNPAAGAAGRPALPTRTSTAPRRAAAAPGQTRTTATGAECGTGDHARTAPDGTAEARPGGDGSEGAAGADGPVASDQPAPPPAGLPKRRRGETMAAAHPGGAPSDAPAAPARGSSRPGAPAAARFSSFREAVRTTTEGTPR
ncbi:ATP-binding protein [Streptomyces sp. ODS05-4]|uniref:sensor histidine kinase n=1 Tax=Streptomyces sp. ODS05-4 TaxID=2944939 RepID=UPI00210AC05E|nr:ATP-binding protein [Streptomyces sp. ODS05-4]